MVKVPSHDTKPTINIYRKISAVIIVKSKVVINKKRLHPKEFTSFQPKTPQTNFLVPLIIEQLQVLSNKFDSFTSKYE
jgi:hypothetical protein